MMLRTRVLSLALPIFLSFGCRSPEREPESKGVATRPAPPSAPRGPEALLELPRSAYSAILHVDAEQLYVITPGEIAKWSATRPLERKSVDLGSAMAPRRDEVIFAQGGALRRSFWGEDSSAILRVEKMPPERLVATESGIFVLQRSPEGTSRISLLVNGTLTKLYETSSLIATLSAAGDRAFFVEATVESFRIVSVSSGGRTAFGVAHPGRTPAALSVSDSIYYYDGPRGEIRRASLALDKEELVASDVVCSPLHVADRIYCAFPGTIAAIGLNGASRVDLAVHARGPITSLTTFENRLVWIEDAGAERLVVRSLPLE